MPKRPPILQAELERIAKERLAAEREVERVKRRDLVRVCLECIGSCALGLFGFGFALHTTDHATGMIAFWGGLLVGYAGMFISLYGAYHRGHERGDW